MAPWVFNYKRGVPLLTSLSRPAASEGIDASGTNLKSYIEALLEKEVEDMDEAVTYKYLCNVRPDGDVELSEEVQIPCPERLSL